MKKTLSKREQNALAVRNRLIESGLKLFQQPGYYQTDIRMITVEAGIALGTFYNYFDDKLGLYLAVFEKEFRKLEMGFFSNEILKNPDDLPPVELIYSFLCHQLSSHNHSILFYREAAALTVLEPRVQELSDNLNREAVALLKQFLLPLVGNRFSKDLETPLSVILRSVEENLHALIGKSSSEKEKTLRALAEMVAGYLFPKLDLNLKIQSG